MKRPFTGLRHRPPHARYDVVVIGSGIGGLVAANLLADAGRRVLLVEQHYMAGGYCSTFRRAGYTFDAATHFYPLLGNPQTLTGRLLGQLGCTTRWVRMDPVDTFHFPDGTRFVVAADFERYLADVEAAFPDAREPLRAFFEVARQAYADGLQRYFRGIATERNGRYLGWTLAEALARFIPDPRLRLLLAADCAHWGSPPSRTSFVFDSMLRFSYFLGNYFPAGGSQAFADDLARVFEERGGEIAMSTRCERIVVEDGRVAGVELTTLRGPLAGRHWVAAPVVLSNADLRSTVERLLPAEVVDDAVRASLRRLRPTFPCFLTHLGVREVPTAVLERAQGYYWADWDAEQVGGDGLIGKIFVPTLYAPELAPPGGHVVILQKVQAAECLPEGAWIAGEPPLAPPGDAGSAPSAAGEGDGDPAQAPTSHWAAHKAAVEARLMAHLERVVPGISEQVVTRSSASARTSERFTLNFQGAMLGWEMAPDQLGEARPARQGIVPGLHLVGHWTRPGGGVTPVIVSAQQVAEEILAERAP
jgi:phytoene dehydrogenase-like protein